MTTSKVIITFIFTVVVSTATGQELFNKLYLQKKVKSVKNSSGQTFNYDKGGKLCMEVYNTKVLSDRYKGTFHYYYNKEGNIEKVYAKGYAKENDTAYWDSDIFIYLYNDGKKTRKLIDYLDSNRNIDTIEFYSYDKLGNLTSQEQINEHLHRKTIYKYGQDGLTDTIFIYDNINMAWGASQLSDTMFLKEATAYKYNTQGKLIFENQFLPKYKPSLPYTNYEYNGYGELVKIQKNLGRLGGCAVDIFITYETITNKYLNGLLIESITELMAEEVITHREIVIYKYNKRGLLIKEKTITYNLNAKKELVEDWRSLDKYQYKYYRR